VRARPGERPASRPYRGNDKFILQAWYLVNFINAAAVENFLCFGIRKIDHFDVFFKIFSFIVVQRVI
jgi:hypothetical protein